jgi:hypothetical protein
MTALFCISASLPALVEDRCFDGVLDCAQQLHAGDSARLHKFQLSVDYSILPRLDDGAIDGGRSGIASIVAKTAVDQRFVVVPGWRALA